MAGFLADSLQTPLHKEAGTFVKIDDQFIRLKGDISSLLYNNYLVIDAGSIDPRYPNRIVYNLARFTTIEKEIVGLLIDMAKAGG